MGREQELARVDGLLAAAAAGECTSLLLQAEPGMGKTTLLEAARSRAAGFTCLTTRGVESESQLAHAGLLALLNPVRSLLSDVPDSQAAALHAALGWASTSAGAAADPFLVGAATLSVLAAAAERRPVLVLVDDLHWLDPESSAALLFAARRLGPDAVGFLLAARTGSLRADLMPGVPLLELGGLSRQAAATLLPHDMTPAVVADLVDGTRGNPLALLEVAPRLDDAQRVGAAPLPDPLPAGEQLQRLYRATLSGLSSAAWQAVLLLALSDRAEAVIEVLASWDVDPATALDEAREHRVLVREGAHHRFRHPLLRSAVLERATTAEALRAHAALAQALPVGARERVWHRAGAVLGTDSRVADDLARRGEEDRERLGHAAASVAWERASELTPDADLAAERLALAAHDAFLAGDVGRVRALVERVLHGSAPDRARGEALFTLGMLEQYAGSVPGSVEHLHRAAALLDGAVLIRALTELALARFRLNDVVGIVDCARQIDASADHTDLEQQLLACFVSGVALVLDPDGDLAAGLSKLAGVRRLTDLPPLRHDPRALLLMALAAGFTGQVGDAVTAGAPRLQEVRRRGAVGVLVPSLAILAAGRAWLGDHAGAYADAGEAAELADHLGYTADGSVAVEMLAWQAAARGLHEEARESLTRARVLLDCAGTEAFAAHHVLTSAFCALCRGDLDEVVSLLERRLAVDGGVGAMGEPLGVAPLLVEAYSGLGRSGDARALTTRYAEVTPTGAIALSDALLGRCRALTARDEPTAAAAFEAALVAHGAAEDPFEAARTRLLYGARLRRSGRRVAARGHLTAAREAFDSMDLTHWSGVAAHELAATGATARRRSMPGPAPLTSQETRVALLAAQGMSNREIAASLFLSPKTVERHLSNVFQKRGYRSRAQLAAFFAGPPTSGG